MPKWWILSTTSWKLGTPYCSHLQVSFMITYAYVNTIPGEKLLGLPKLQAFEAENFSVAEIVQCFFNGIENIVGKGENAGSRYFYRSYHYLGLRVQKN